MQGLYVDLSNFFVDCLQDVYLPQPVKTGLKISAAEDLREH